MPFRKAVLSLAVLLLATVPLALAQGTYTEIAYPGANGTFARGIDSAGDVVGSYTDSADHSHGFLLSGGVYTTIDYGGVDTYLFGINDEGQIVGANDSDGFVYDIATRRFRTVRYQNFYTLPFGINNLGAIVGIIEKSNLANLGFRLVGSTYTVINGPLGGPNTQLFAVSDGGVAVGYDVSATNFTDFFVGKGGEYHDVIIPNAPNASLFGIDFKGLALAGAYSPALNSVFGFVYVNGKLVSLQYPGGHDTYVFGINTAGQAVGAFNGLTQSYLWTPSADAAKK